MANIKDLIQSIESSDSSFDEKLAAINEMEETLEAMRAQEQEAIDDNVSLIVEAIKVMERKVEAQLEMARAIVPEKGDKGERGRDGQNGRDGLNGKDGKDGQNGKDGQDGADGVSVTDAKIDFDGSLVITLSTGREINVGEVVAPDLAEKIKVISTMSTNTAIADITGGTINNTVIGGTTPAAGTFTTLTATSTATLGGDATNPSFRAIAVAGATRWIDASGSVSGTPQFQSASTGAATGMNFITRGASNFNFSTSTSAGTVQAVIAHTASAVNFVQVTGAATGGFPTISTQGSDANIHLGLTSKGNGTSFGIRFYTNNGAQEQFRVQHAVSAVNFATVNGSAAGNALQYYAQGTDTNVSMAFQSKGTGAINLAPGSLGVNISNGGTVTAITRTNSSGTYTSVPTVAISAPTTAGGVQATANAINMIQSGSSPTINSGGTGYTVGDVLTIVGGTPTGSAATMTVTSVSGGVITGINYTNFATYSVLPTNPFSVTGGTGSGATFTSVWYPLAFTITNAGSGYVEQPTVTFSGGGGSGAAAYATVGAGTIIDSLGSTMSFTMPAGESLRLRDAGGTATDFVFAVGSPFGRPVIGAQTVSGGGNASLGITSWSTGSLQLYTNNTATEQARIAHTASAVNFVQVTGAATGGRPTVSAQGSDTNVGLTFIGKGNARAAAFFNNSASTSWQLSVGVNGVTTAVNFLDASGSAASSAPVLSAQGSDTNIDLALTTKGIGGHLFYGGAGTYLTHEAYGQASSVNRFRTTSTASSVSPLFSAVGSDANISIRMRTQGTGSYQFETGSSGNEQLRIANTASAVNYVQVTGAATGSSIGPSFTAAGSDAVVPLTFTTKSTGAHRFVTGAGLAVTFVDSGGTTANFLQIQGRQAGNGPIISAQGSDTNIDLALTPKGTGNVRFGTYTGTVSTIAGYIEIKDSGGTIRRLAVVA